MANICFCQILIFIKVNRSLWTVLSDSVDHTYHALVTLSTNDVLLTATRSSLFVTQFIYRAIGVTLTGCERGEGGEEG